MTVLAEVVPVVPGVELVSAGIEAHAINPVQKGRKGHAHGKEDLEGPEETQTIKRRGYREEETRHISRSPGGSLVSLGSEDRPLVRTADAGPRFTALCNKGVSKFHQEWPDRYGTTKTARTCSF